MSIAGEPESYNRPSRKELDELAFKLAQLPDDILSPLLEYLKNLSHSIIHDKETIASIDNLVLVETVRMKRHYNSLCKPKPK